MLRVGLTGELGSGKSTVARMLAERGAIVLSSDEMGRALMQPGQPVYNDIVARFDPAIVQPDGTLDRRELARLAFDPAHPRVEELNAIVHPAVLTEQARVVARLAQTQPNAIVIIESALIFTANDGPAPWRNRFDAIILVTAPEALKIARFVARGGNAADARARLARQAIFPAQSAECLKIENDADLSSLEAKVENLWSQLHDLRPAADHQ